MCRDPACVLLPQQEYIGVHRSTQEYMQKLSFCTVVPIFNRARQRNSWSCALHCCEQALAPFIDPVTKEKVKFVYSKDLRHAEAPKDVSGVVREEAPVTEPVEPSKPISKSVEDAFSPYASFYCMPYDESAYRTFLRKAS